MTARLIASTLILFLATACADNPPTELDVTPFQNRVCDLLTLDQLAGFHITQPESQATIPPAHPACGRSTTPESW